MKYKIIALKYEILEIKDYKENEFLVKLSLTTLEAEVNELLKKNPEIRDQILLKAETAKSEILTIYSKSLDSIQQEEAKIALLETDIISKREKLEHYKTALNETNARLAIIIRSLSETPSNQHRIDQLKAKIALLKRVESEMTIYYKNINAYIRNTYIGAQEEISDTIKGFYRGTASLTIKAPFLYQYSREAITELIRRIGNLPINENLISSLINDEEKDFTWMALLYIERYPVIELTKEDANSAFATAGFSKQEIADAIKKMFNDKEEFFVDVWTLMRPIEDWPTNIQCFLGLFYDSLVTKDSVSPLINKAKNKKLISTEDYEQIVLALKGRISIETSLLLRVNIHLLLTNLIENLKKEKIQEQREDDRLEKSIAEAQRKKIKIPEDIIKRASEAKKHTLDMVKNYYPQIIQLLDHYTQIIYTQAVNRYDEQLIPFLERFQQLVDDSANEIKELSKPQTETTKLIEEKNELQQQVSGLNIVISSMIHELEQNITTLTSSKEVLAKNTTKLDTILDKVDNIIHKLKNIIEHPYTEENVEEVMQEPETNSDSINIIGINDWTELQGNTIYSATNETGVKKYFMFSKNILEKVEEIYSKKFLSAMKHGYVGAIDTNGIKFMKERKKEGTEYEIKVIGIPRRIIGTIKSLGGQEVIVFSYYEAH